MSEHLPPTTVLLGFNEHTAYQSCLVLEALGSSWGVVVSEAVMFKFTSCSTESWDMHFVTLLPLKAKAQLAREIIDCNNNGEFLAGLSYLYVMGMIRGPVPTSLSSHSSRASFQATAGNITAALAQPTIMRDNYPCIVSGIVDLVGFEKDPMRFNEAPEVVAATTSLGHIFGQLMMDHKAGMTTAARVKLEWAATAAAVIERFAADGLHATFDRLSFSLCPIEDDNNTYKIHTHPPNRHATYRLPDRVTLMDATNREIPLPDRRYFQLHHACATISHLSGAGKVVEQLFPDMEDVKIFAEDRGSNHLLSLALSSRLQAL
ncbi:hypothetical protein IW261DRAFT_1513841, partial [Armillaria novae-zelandiae]